MGSRTAAGTGLAAVVAAVALGVAVTTGTTGPPGPDLWWGDSGPGTLPGWALTAALVLDRVGGGWVAVLVVPLLVCGLVLLRRGPGAALWAVGCFLASAGTVQALKHLYSRARPEDQMVMSDHGSFPSGHTANAATIAVVLVLLFPSVWTMLAGALWVLAMAASRIVLSVHWASDTLGGALVGVGVVLLLAALPVTRRWRGDGVSSSTR